MRNFLFALHRFAGGKQLTCLTLILLLASLADSLGLVFLLPILQGVMNQTPPHVLDRYLLPLGLPSGWIAILAAFALLILLRSLFSHWREMGQTRLRCEFVAAQRQMLGQALFMAEWRYLAGLDHARLQRVWNDDLNRINQGTSQILQAAVTLLLIIGQVLVACWISPQLTLIALILLALAAWTMRNQLARAQALGLDLSSANQRTQRLFKDLLSGLKLYKAFAIEAQQHNELAAQAQALTHEQIRFAALQSQWRKLAELTGLAGVGLVFALGWWGLQLPPAALLLFVFLVMRIAGATKQLQQNIQLLGHMLPAFRHLQSTLTEIRTAAEPYPSTCSIQRPRLLALDKVSVAYEGKQVLQGLSLSLESNTTIALVGPSGSGKSTLCDILMGLLSPEQGAFLLDDKVADGTLRRNWRSHMAYVPQDALLLSGTIRSNLLLSQPDATDAELWQALEHAAAAEFVRERLGQLDAPIGESGMQLSGGERQRLALARALLRNPWLLVLDEVSSQLDQDNECRIAHAIRQLHGKMTIILIAHRPALLSVADRVLRLEDGQLIEISTQ